MMKKVLGRLCLALLAAFMMGTTLPVIEGQAKTRTMPTAFRGEWFHKDGEVPLYMKITKKKLRVTLGMYQKGKWGDVKRDKTVRLGTKVKKNKTFTISKPDKSGYRTIKINADILGGKNSAMTLKPKKVNHKMRLTDRGGKRAFYFVPITKTFMKNYMGVK